MSVTSDDCAPYASPTSFRSWSRTAPHTSTSPALRDVSQAIMQSVTSHPCSTAVSARSSRSAVPRLRLRGLSGARDEFHLAAIYKISRCWPVACSAHRPRQVGRNGVEELLNSLLTQMTFACQRSHANVLPPSARSCARSRRRVRPTHHGLASIQRDEIPGVGPALATALVASLANPRAFRSGRDFSAWVGLVPKQSSSGGKVKLGNITKRGNRYLRSLFTGGALAVIRYAKIHGTRHRPWLTALFGAAANEGGRDRAGE